MQSQVEGLVADMSHRARASWSIVLMHGAQLKEGTVQQRNVIDPKTQMQETQSEMICLLVVLSTSRAAVLGMSCIMVYLDSDTHSLADAHPTTMNNLDALYY